MRKEEGAGSGLGLGGWIWVLGYDGGEVICIFGGYVLNRGVAQPGSALASGARGRRFKSCRPDLVTLIPTTTYVVGIFVGWSLGTVWGPFGGRFSGYPPTIVAAVTLRGSLITANIVCRSAC